MEDSDKAKSIVRLLTREYELVVSQYINYSASLAKAIKGDELWKEQEERDGSMGFSKSPYNVELARNVVKTSLAQKMEVRSILDYAIDVFLSKIPDEEVVHDESDD
jgi:hypothetical protein